MNQSQPQTLQGAVMFSYLNAALALIYSIVLGGASIFYLPILVLAVAAYGIANDRKWGYWGGVVLSFLNLFGVLAIIVVGGGFSGILNLLFAGVLVALLLHPESRHYQRIWFR